MPLFEVEFKYVDPDGRFLAILERRRRPPTWETSDIYFDTKAFSYFLKGTFIRLRKESGRETLDVKFDDPRIATSNAHDFSIEESIDLAQGAITANARESFSLAGLKTPQGRFTFRKFLAENKLIRFIRITKNRRLYRLRGFRVFVDDVSELGRYIEVEVRVRDEKNIPTARKRIGDSFEKYHLQRIRTGYVELALKKQQPGLYERGRFKG
jgi:adenylate cyclase class IV